MLKICTVFFEGKYHPNSVSQLYRSLKEHSKVPFEFICLADRGVDADVVLPYNKHSNIKLHWHKLKFFSEQFAYQKPGDDIIIMDIDQQIVGNVDEILSWPVKDGEILCTDRGTRAPLSLPARARANDKQLRKATSDEESYDTSI